MAARRTGTGGFPIIPNRAEYRRLVAKFEQGVNRRSGAYFALPVLAEAAAPNARCRALSRPYSDDQQMSRNAPKPSFVSTESSSVLGIDSQSKTPIGYALR